MTEEQRDGGTGRREAREEGTELTEGRRDGGTEGRRVGGSEGPREGGTRRRDGGTEGNSTTRVEQV